MYLIKPIAIVCLLVSCACLSEEESHTPVEIEVRLQKPVIFPGEPCYVVWRFKNVGDEAIILDMGIDDGKERCSFEILDLKGAILESEGKKKRREGFATVKIITLEKGDTKDCEVLLNEWCGTLLPEAKYTIKCHIEIPGIPPASRECKIEIKKASAAERRATFQSLYDDILNMRNNVEVTERRAAALAYSGAIETVPFLVKLITGGAYHYDQEILALERIGSIEAAEALASLLRPEARRSDYIRRQVLESVRRVFEKTKDEKVKAMLAPLIDVKTNIPSTK